MVVAGFNVGLPELEYTLEHLPDVTIRLADVRAGRQSSHHSLFWMSGVDDELASTLAADPSVASAEQLSGDGSHHLFRVEFVDDLVGLQSYDTMVDLDGMMLDAVSTDGNWEVKVFFPTRENLSTFYDRCLDLGLQPRLDWLSNNRDAQPDADYGLTESQRLTLIEATERGYFSVPKDVSLVELASVLGVSDQAVSERLRRGMEKLVWNTLLRRQAAERPAPKP